MFLFKCWHCFEGNLCNSETTAFPGPNLLRCLTGPDQLAFSLLCPSQTVGFTVNPSKSYGLFPFLYALSVGNRLVYHGELA